MFTGFTFRNSEHKDLSSKHFFLTTIKSAHSIKIYLTVIVLLHATQTGGSSFLQKKEIRQAKRELFIHLSLSIFILFVYLCLCLLLTGYIQTPMFDGISLNSDESSRIIVLDVPANHSVLFTFELLDDCGPLGAEKVFRGPTYDM